MTSIPLIGLAFSSETSLSRRFRVSYLFALAALALACILILVGLYYAIRPARAFTVVQPVEVLTPEVKAGHAVALRIEYCKEARDVAIVGAVLWRHGVMIPLNLWPSDLPLGCHKAAVLLSIPSYVPPDTYTLYMVREYRPSVVGVAGFAIASQPFKVLPYDGTVATPPLIQLLIPGAPNPASPAPSKGEAAPSTLYERP